MKGPSQTIGIGYARSMAIEGTNCCNRTLKKCTIIWRFNIAGMSLREEALPPPSRFLIACFLVSASLIPTASKNLFYVQISFLQTYTEAVWTPDKDICSLPYFFAVIRYLPALQIVVLAKGISNSWNLTALGIEYDKDRIERWLSAKL